MSRKFLWAATLLLPIHSVDAKVSIGYMHSAGVEYLNHPNIVLHSQQLFLSKAKIKADETWLNPTQQNAQHYMLFTLPKVPSNQPTLWANTLSFNDRFQLKVNANPIRTQRHVRAFIYDGQQDVDVTAALRQCGLSESELLNPSTAQWSMPRITEKIRNCELLQTSAQLQQLLMQDQLVWSSQIIYSWLQEFKAKTKTSIQYEYQPLLAGAVGLPIAQQQADYCINDAVLDNLKYSQASHAPYSQLSFSFAQGIEQAQPIAHFKLMVERDQHELMAWCWDGKIKHISDQIAWSERRDFMPEHDLKLIFIDPRRNRP